MHLIQNHGRKEENVLFNDTLNTFYLRLYGVRHMVKDHFDSEKGNPLPPHRLLFPINSKGSFVCTIPETELRSWTSVTLLLVRDGYWMTSLWDYTSLTKSVGLTSQLLAVRDEFNFPVNQYNTSHPIPQSHLL